MWISVMLILPQGDEKIFLLDQISLASLAGFCLRVILWQPMNLGGRYSVVINSRFFRLV
jgi:hypothetical protein